MKNCYLVALLSLFLSISASIANAYSVSNSLTSGSLLGCLNSSGATDQAKCDTNYPPSGTTDCTLIPSSSDMGVSIAICTQAGDTYCLQDSDCTSLGQNKCVISRSSRTAFIGAAGTGTLPTGATAITAGTGPVGICSSTSATAENNAFGTAICNILNIVTGTAGRGVVAVAVIVIGIMFFLGKISWSMVLAVALGSGAMFGAPSVVRVITGKKFMCG